MLMQWFVKNIESNCLRLITCFRKTQDFYALISASNFTMSVNLQLHTDDDMVSIGTECTFSTLSTVKRLFWRFITFCDIGGYTERNN